jgi:hypothetical protein
MRRRLDQTPHAARLRRQTVEYPFGALKFWMGSAHFLMKTLPRVRTEMSLHVLAYNLKRAMNILGTKALEDAARLFPSFAPIRQLANTLPLHLFPHSLGRVLPITVRQ